MAARTAAYCHRTEHLYICQDTVWSAWFVPPQAESDLLVVADELITIVEHTTTIEPQAWS